MASEGEIPFLSKIQITSNSTGVSRIATHNVAKIASPRFKGRYIGLGIGFTIDMIIITSKLTKFGGDLDSSGTNIFPGSN